MQTNDFEKNVQQQMEKFMLAPNDDVWLKVEGRIRKEKNRRRVFLLWFFAGLLLVAIGGIHLYTNSVVKENYPANTSADREARRIEGKKDLGEDGIKKNLENSIVQGKNLPNDKANINGSNTTGARLQKRNTTDANTTNPPAKHRYAELANTKNKDVKSIVGIARRSFNNTGYKTGITRATKPTFKNTMASFDKETYVPGSFKGTLPADLNRSIKPGDEALAYRSTEEKVLPATTGLNTDSKIVTTPGEEKVRVVENVPLNGVTRSAVHQKKKGTSKWDFGFFVLAGLSDNVNSLSILPNAKTADVYASPSQLGSSPALTLSQVVTYKSAFSLGGGFFANRSLSKRWSLQAGLDYHFYTVKTSVGQKVDSLRVFSDAMLNNTVSVGSFYRTGQSVSEKSFYHLVELPITAQWSVSKNENHTFKIITGFSPGVLIGSNALYYNRTTGTFYKENDQFKSFLFSLNGGFMYGLFASRKYKVAVGPIVQYGLTNLTKIAARTDEHLFFAGIKASLTLKK